MSSSAILAVLLFLLSYSFGPFRERRTFRCEVCFAKKDAFQWRLGAWGDSAIPITASRESISETRFADRFLPLHKNHQWVFAQGSPYYWGFRWGGCALGSGRHISDALMTFEKYPEFGAFIEKKIGAGELTREEVVAIISERRYSTNATATAGVKLVNEFFDSESR